MPGLTVKAACQDIRKIPTDSLIVGFHEDVRPLKGLAGELDWLLCGALSDLLIRKRLRGSPGEMALVTSQGKVPAQKIFLVGLGPKQGFSLATLRTVARTAAASAVSAGAGSAAIEYFHPSEASCDDAVPALWEGLSEGAGGRALDVTLIVPDGAAYEAIARLIRR